MQNDPNQKPGTGNNPEKETKTNETNKTNDQANSGKEQAGKGNDQSGRGSGLSNPNNLKESSADEETFDPEMEPGDEDQMEEGGEDELTETETDEQDIEGKPGNGGPDSKSHNNK